MLCTLPRAFAVAILAAPPLEAAAAGDLSGGWTYRAICPGTETVRGEIHLDCAPGGGSCEGGHRNDLGLLASLTVWTEGDEVVAEIDWGEGVTRALGTLAPDGHSFIVEDFEGCRSEVVREAI